MSANEISLEVYIATKASLTQLIESLQQLEAVIDKIIKGQVN